MARSVDASKRRAWSERLQRFVRCGQTVAAFCESEGISMPSFYQWRRKLAGRKSCKRSYAKPSARQTFVPLKIVSPADAKAPIEIQLPNGTRVYLTGGDRELIGAAIAAAGQLPRVAETADATRREVP